jgi:hypothetical protein
LPRFQVVAKLRALKPKADEKPDLKKIREVASEVINQVQFAILI